MKRMKKIIIFTTLAILILVGGGILLYNLLFDEDSLSVEEKRWIDNNNNTVISISIPNDLPVFGYTGEGVFFDFINYLDDNLNLNVNRKTISYLSMPTDYGFEITDNYDKNGILFYKDHYVVVSKSAGLLGNADIRSLRVGIFKPTLSHIQSYYGGESDEYAIYESYPQISEDLANGKLAYALVPLSEFKDQIIANDINILKHISDLNRYYYFRTGDNEKLNSILKKSVSLWKKSFNNSFNENNYKLFINKLNISEAEEVTLTNKVYKYGLSQNDPYEILSGGEYGGITAQYLRSFSEFSGADFTFRKYKNSKELMDAVSKSRVDMYYNYYDITTKFVDAGALKEISYYVIADNSIDLSLTNINGLANEEVYVLENSYIYNAIKDLEGIKIHTYKTINELKKVAKKANIIIIDENTYTYFLANANRNYSVRFRGVLSESYYSFRYKNTEDTFYKLFSSYTKTIDPSDLIRSGVTTYNKVSRKGLIIKRIALSVLGIVLIVILVIFVINRNKKVVKLNTKLKKEDRIKYIDMLTSLKNRNYYNEQVSSWNKNKIYPQTCIVIDINNFKELNDTMGHEEGDKLIQEVANVLIKTQIDNTEIMRTNGNEFLVYMVGYNEKQVSSFVKRLVKGFNRIGYQSGVALGYSMIEDDTKLVEDAFNEATIKMRENKPIVGGNDEEEN